MVIRHFECNKCYSLNTEDEPQFEVRLGENIDGKYQDRPVLVKLDGRRCRSCDHVKIGDYLAKQVATDRDIAEFGIRDMRMDKVLP